MGPGALQDSAISSVEDIIDGSGVHDVIGIIEQDTHRVCSNLAYVLCAWERSVRHGDGGFKPFIEGHVVGYCDVRRSDSVLEVYEISCLFRWESNEDAADTGSLGLLLLGDSSTL